MSEQATTGDAPHVRRLLPLPPLPLAERSPSTRARPSRLNPVKGACDACRKQKAKVCSGKRPTCRRCVQQRIQCHYTTEPGETESQAAKRRYTNLQERAAAYEEILELLKNLADREAQNILQRIRSGTDITTILNHVKAGNILLQMNVLPETRFRYEFPYRSEMPEYYVRDNQYLNSLIYEATSLYSKDRYSKSTRHNTPSLVADLDSHEYQSLYLKPFHAAQVVDPRLSDVKISLWTTVCKDDVLMRDLLGVFLRCEYHFTAAIQKDYFLEDMAAQREDFCSSLLVNMVLAYSCVCYPHFSNRAEYWNPNTLLYRFVAEAKRIWELQANEARITTIQAGILFNVFYNLCGLDEIGQVYRIHAVALAHKLRLFDRTIEGQSDRMCKGRAFTAWTLYNWETLVGFSFMLSPLLKKPPDWPLPAPSEDSQWYGEIWVKYPLNHSLSPSYFGQVFRARCQFRVIMNEFCQLAYSKGSKVTLDKANELHSRLRSWYVDLPGPLLPKTIVLPGHLQLHIYYYHLILTIYEPLLDMETIQESSSQQIVADARKNLQTLIRLYYLRHGFDAMDLFIVIPLMLAAKGLCSQRQNHFLAQALYQVIRGRMRPQEVALLKDAVNLDEDEPNEKRVMLQAVRSHWPVSVVKKMDDLDSHLLTNLVENYAHLNMEEKPVAAQDS
ncbi:MAG: hypothetical protein M1836_005347 [Candelina mexicana]|nr:MAG: hypothetical protein M1836_005347 [Candelina mexicana]